MEQALQDGRLQDSQTARLAIEKANAWRDEQALQAINNAPGLAALGSNWFRYRLKTPGEYLFFAEQVIAKDQHPIGAVVEARTIAEILRSLDYEPIQPSLLS